MSRPSRSRFSRRNRWLSYESSRRLQRDVLMGLAMVFVAALGLLVIGVFSDSFRVELVDGVPVAEGKECVLLQAAPVDEPTTPPRLMVDCGNESALGASGVIRHALIALGAVGVLLILSALFSFVLSSRMPRETLAVPFCVVAIVIGIVAIWWGFSDTGGPALVFQGDRERAVTGLLRSGGQFSGRQGAISAGVGLIAGSIVRLTRP